MSIPGFMLHYPTTTWSTVDSSNTRIAVIGAGVSGLLSAYYIIRSAGSLEVRVFEARGSSARPHCTGLISAETAERLPLSREAELARFKLVKLLVPELKLSASFSYDRYAITRLDRVRFEKMLLDDIVLRGVEVSYNDPVYEVRRSEGGWDVRSRSGSSHYDYLILASGYNARLPGLLGLKRCVRVLSGVQIDVEVGNRSELAEDSITAIISSYLGGGFAWLVPLGGRGLTIGCASDNRSITSLECLRMMTSLASKLYGSIKPFSGVYGGAVLRGYPIEAIGEGVVGLGDAVAMVKSLSGGGLYGISIASRLIPELILRGKYRVQTHLTRLARDLRQQYYLSKSVPTLLKLARSVGLAGKRLYVHVGKHLSYDDHIRMFIESLTSRALAAPLTSRNTLEITI